MTIDSKEVGWLPEVSQIIYNSTVQEKWKASRLCHFTISGSHIKR
jgi:hypothetical protein